MSCRCTVSAGGDAAARRQPVSVEDEDRTHPGDTSPDRVKDAAVTPGTESQRAAASFTVIVWISSFSQLLVLVLCPSPSCVLSHRGFLRRLQKNVS